MPKSLRRSSLALRPCAALMALVAAGCGGHRGSAASPTHTAASDPAHRPAPTCSCPAVVVRGRHTAISTGPRRAATWRSTCRRRPTTARASRPAGGGGVVPRDEQPVRARRGQPWAATILHYNSEDGVRAHVLPRQHARPAQARSATAPSASRWSTTTAAARRRRRRPPPRRRPRRRALPDRRAQRHHGALRDRRVGRRPRRHRRQARRHPPPRLPRRSRTARSSSTASAAPTTRSPRSASARSPTRTPRAPLGRPQRRRRRRRDLRRARRGVDSPPSCAAATPPIRSRRAATPRSPTTDRD